MLYMISICLKDNNGKLTLKSSSLVSASHHLFVAGSTMATATRSTIATQGGRGPTEVPLTVCRWFAVNVFFFFLHDLKHVINHKVSQPWIVLQNTRDINKSFSVLFRHTPACVIILDHVFDRGFPHRNATDWWTCLLDSKGRPVIFGGSDHVPFDAPVSKWPLILQEIIYDILLLDKIGWIMEKWFDDLSWFLHDSPKNMLLGKFKSLSWMVCPLLAHWVTNALAAGTSGCTSDVMYQLFFGAKWDTFHFT